MVVSLNQMSDSKVIFHDNTCNSIPDIYMFGYSGEMMLAIVIRAQATAKVVMLSMDESRDIGHNRHNGSPDYIGQARLPLVLWTLFWLLNPIFWLYHDK